MKKKIYAMLLGLCIACQAVPVAAQVLNFEATVNTYKQDNKTPYFFQIQNASGKTVQAVAKEDTVYVTSKRMTLRNIPDSKGEGVKRVLLGAELHRVAVCNNGWSKVILEQEDGERAIGYVPNRYLSDTPQLTEVRDKVTAAMDCDILDYPGRKDGQVIGELLQMDEVRRTGTINGVWSRIVFRDAENKKRVGYIPTSALEGQETEETKVAKADTEEESVNAGTIHKSKGDSIFAEAVEGVNAATQENVNGVQVGSPIAVSSDAVLKPMGTFRITHYCQCSICCGPWADGITATGVTATTNRTIAVDPAQIPYGTKIVINGQVYVAEDCGGAITENCIDIYVASHEEGESKGVYYTDVYIIQE